MSERSLETLVPLAADRRRRQALHHLRHETNGQTTIDDLIDALSDSESGPHDQQIDREELAIQLHHVHLPKLTEVGVVDFDTTEGTVRYQPDEQIERILDELTAESPAHP